jgi:hypothetical protein
MMRNNYVIKRNISRLLEQDAFEALTVHSEKPGVRSQKKSVLVCFSPGFCILAPDSLTVSSVAGWRMDYR